MKWSVMVSAPYMQPVLEQFLPWFERESIRVIVPPVNERLSEDELLRWAADVEGVICGDDRFSARVLQALPRLQVISKWGTGIDSIDKDACQQLGIALYNTPNAFTQPVADTALGFMLAFARNIPGLDAAMKANEWRKVPGVSLQECALGVIGVGNIGKAVIKRAAAFGMRIIGNDIIEIPQEFVREFGVEVADLPSLIAQADFVSIHCDLNPTSYHLLGENEFAVMKKSAVLINTARGPIVDEAALAAALKRQAIAGAGLDVFEVEPLPADSPLRAMSNVLLSPHNSNSSPQAWERVHHNTINNLITELKRRQSEVSI